MSVLAESGIKYGDYLYYIETNGEIEITDCDEKATTIEIPSEIEGKKVTAIGKRAFFNCSNIVSITIPDNVTTIGEDAFTFCDSLTNISIPSSIKHIGRSAFSNCKTLNKVNISDINAWCQIDFENHYANPLWKGRPLYLNNALVTQLELSDKTSSISNYAFFGCQSLKEVNIPNSVTSIGTGAFAYCENITNINMPSNVTNIGDEAFSCCNKLTNITIPDGITSIGDSTFNWCESLTDIKIPNSVTRIGSYAFNCCKKLTSVTLPKSITYIDTFAFYECNELSAIYYTGTESEWNNISKGTGIHAKIYYILPYENTIVYNDGKEESTVTAKFVSDDVYLCIEDFFEYYGFETEYNGSYLGLGNAIIISVNDEKLAYFMHPWSTYTDRYDFSSYDFELCEKYFDLNSSYISTDKYSKEKDFDFALTKAWIELDSEHHYIYYKDLQNILDFDLISAPEINTIAIYRNKKVPENITLYDKKGNAKEICSIFKDKYIALGYKENLDDVLIIPESKVVSAEGIKVSLNGGLLEFDVLPTTINDRTMVPLRAIFEALSASVDWNEQTRTVTSKKGNTTVKLTVDSDKMTVNDKMITLDSPATVVDNRTLVPVRAISEAFDINVDWDGNNSLVILRENEYKDIETVLLYNSLNQVSEVPDYDVDIFKANGWVSEKPVRMYALDGRTQLVAASEVAENKKVGWYTEPSIMMYAPDGRTQVVAKNDIESNKAVGWYDYPVTQLYAADGRTIVIASSEEQSYRNVGWYTPIQYNAMQYAYLAGSDFRSIKRQYPHAVAQGATLYSYTDSNGDSCVLVYIAYKITSNWNAYYLHNLSKGTVIENPVDYYSNISNDYYGADKLKYMDLSIEANKATIEALKIFTGETNSGWFVDAATLNL